MQALKLKLFSFPLLTAFLYFLFHLLNTFPDDLINELNVGELQFLHVFVITSYGSILYLFCFFMPDLMCECCLFSLITLLFFYCVALHVLEKHAEII